MNTKIGQKNITQKINLKSSVLATLAFFLTFSTSTFADDTEVFVKSSSYEGGKPNILIMIDSSSSMNQNIKYYDNYDPTLEFTGNLKCDNDKIYVDTQNNPNTPGCNNTDTIDPSALRCRDIADFLLKVGAINDRVYQWDEDSETWGEFGVASSANAQTAPIECLNDQGVHGDAQILTVDANGNVALDSAVYPIKETTQAYITNSGNIDPDTSIKAAWSDTKDTDLTWDDEKFVTFYTGHFLNYVDKNPTELVNTDGATLARTAMTEIIENFSGFNLGLARYNLGGNKTAAIWAPVVSLDDPDIKKELIENYIDAMGHKDGTTLPSGFVTTEDNSFSGGQPMAAGQYEGYLYFRGETPHGGGTGGSNGTGLDASPQPPIPTINIPGAVDPITQKYISPITAENGSCQGNYILYLTASGTSADATAPLINDAIGWTETGTEEQLEADQGKCGQGNDECLDDLSQFMFEHDLVLDVQNGTDENGDPVIQNVVTYGISINNSAPDLDEAAVVGGGKFRKAENPGAISAVLQEIITEIIGKNSTFVAPAISINNFNRLENNEELYYSLFTPTDTRVWDGNLKKYKIQQGVIKDANGAPAVDPSTGAFYDNALSYWTDTTDPALHTDEVPVNGYDGNESGLGGFASRLDDSLINSRSVYTNINNNTGHVNLTLSNTILEPTNGSITRAHTGVDQLSDLTDTDKAALHEKLLKWGRGEITDENDNQISTKFIGDLLHTTPTILSYNSGTIDNPEVDSAVFFGTNNGYIHAVDADPFDAPSQMEHFAFAPYETLTNLLTFYNNEESPNKAYGIDGPITAWLDEADDSKNLLVDSGEEAYIYATQRRGGRNIYALDVTDYDNPKLAWKIRGGEGDEFNELGQTWSAVKHASIANSDPEGDPLDVVIFAGGYDTNQDTGSSNTADPSIADASMGRAVYIVNAKTGAYIWHASATDFEDMTYAIPSNISVLDILEGDGHADRLYVGDLGGQIWRFDLGKHSNGVLDVDGGVIASLNQVNADDSPSGLTNRRFFSAPSVSYVANNSYGKYLAIAIGSGYRSHPLDERISDRFYMIKDPYVETSPDYENLQVIYDDSDAVDSDDKQLLNITPGSPEVSSTLLANYQGWVLDFSTSGEKVINPALTADNKIFFTTYVPESETNDVISCAPNAQLGKSRLYALSLFKGSATNTFIDYSTVINADGTVTVTTSSGETFIYDPSENNYEVITNDDGSVTLVDTDNENEVVITLQESDGSYGLYEELTDKGISAEVVFHQEQITITEPNDPNPQTENLITLIVGKQTLNPNIIVKPVRTYWHRID